MKTLKKTISILIISFISMNMIAQEVPNLLFSLNTNSLFKTGKSELKNEGIITLEKIAKKINLTNRAKNYFKNIVIEGHTDDVGSFHSNQILSEKRANIVANQLKKTITNSLIKWTINGYGESKPKVDNNTSENRKINRRINIYVNSKSETTLDVTPKRRNKTSSLDKISNSTNVHPESQTRKNDIWLNALGKTKESKEIQLIYKKFGLPDKPKKNVNSVLSGIFSKSSIWYSQGLSLSYVKNEYNMLKTITFYNIDDKFSQYNQSLPFGLSFTDSPNTLKRKFSHVEKAKNSYKIVFNQKKYPNFYLWVNYNNGKITNITLQRKKYKSFSPFKIDANGTDCEMIATILKDVKYSFSHIKNEKDSTVSFSEEWSSLLNPSFSKKTIIESDLINFEIYKGTDLKVAQETISRVNTNFIDCVNKSGFKVIMEDRTSQTSLNYLSENEDFEIEVFIDRDKEIYNGKEQTVYTCTIKITSYKEYEDCELFEYLYENSKTYFKYLKDGIQKQDLFNVWKTNITTFNDYDITVQSGAITMTVYNGDSLKEANSELATIFNTWEACNKESNKAFIFLKDQNTLDQFLGKRAILYTSYDNISIEFNIKQTLKANNVIIYTSSVRMYLKGK